MTDDLCTPWTLHFDRDGTEDFGIICDAEGDDIVASHLPCTRIAERTFRTGTFRLPEKRDPTPAVLRQLRLMTAAPRLLAHLVSSRFEQHLPYYRIEQMYQRAGLDLSRQTLCGWAGMTHEACRLVIEAIKREVFADGYVQIDEPSGAR